MPYLVALPPVGKRRGKIPPGLGAIGASRFVYSALPDRSGNHSLRQMIVVVQSIGQIGNRLTQFSHLIAFACDHDVRIANLAFSRYSEFFEHTHRDLFCRYPSRSASWVGKRLQSVCYYVVRMAAALRILKLVPNSCWIERHWTDEDYDLGSPEFIEVAKKYKFVFLTGSYQHRYWQNYGAHVEAIREHFRLIPEIAERTSRHVAPIRKAGDVVVGVHVRQGDFADHEGGAFFFTSEDYAGVMLRIESLFPAKKVVFLVCSNAPQSLNSYRGLRVYFGPGAFIEDLYALALCDYIVGPAISSFCIWASLMGKKPRCGLSRPEQEITLADFLLCSGRV